MCRSRQSVEGQLQRLRGMFAVHSLDAQPNPTASDFSAASIAQSGASMTNRFSGLALPVLKVRLQHRAMSYSAHNHAAVKDVCMYAPVWRTLSGFGRIPRVSFVSCRQRLVC